MAVNLSRYLNDGLIGDEESVGTGNRVKRAPLTAGTWAFIFSDGNVYVGEGTQLPRACGSSIADRLLL